MARRSVVAGCPHLISGEGPDIARRGSRRRVRPLAPSQLVQDLLRCTFRRVLLRVHCRFLRKLSNRCDLTTRGSIEMMARHLSFIVYQDPENIKK